MPIAAPVGKPDDPSLEELLVDPPLVASAEIAVEVDAAVGEEVDEDAMVGVDKDVADDDVVDVSKAMFHPTTAIAPTMELLVKVVVAGPRIRISWRCRREGQNHPRVDVGPTVSGDGTGNSICEVVLAIEMGRQFTRRAVNDDVTHGGQHMASVLVRSLTDVATVVHAEGQVKGPMLTAVCPGSLPRPSRPCSHHVVTAGGAHFTLLSISRP
ncbi:hypothetical protein VTK56DRAFT_10135 [Thermocarpiscus australiensis]